MNYIETILPMAIVVFIIATGVVWLNLHFQKNLFKQKVEKDRLNTLHQSELLTSSINAQEEERKRIAQDLHDELGAVLSIMRMHLLLFEEKNATNAFVSDIENVRQLTETALASVRSISHQLMPPQLEKFGLIKTLEAVTDQINKSGKIKIKLQALCSEPIVAWTISLGLYRITMELINNTIKHANASNIVIAITCNTNNIQLAYNDDGCGINATNNNKGLGLKSIEGRVTALKGILEWGDNDVDQGFNTSIQIPI